MNKVDNQSILTSRPLTEALNNSRTSPGDYPWKETRRTVYTYISLHILNSIKSYENNR